VTFESFKATYSSVNNKYDMPVKCLKVEKNIEEHIHRAA
jgi:hypothetical protein